MSPLHKVLVYGTIKSGHSNYSILTESEGTQRFLGLAETVDAFPLVVGTFINIPFLLYERGQGVPVEGELYEVDDAKLARLDKLERHPVFYERKLEKVRLLNNVEIMDAWVYALPKWAPEFMAKSSAPLRVFHESGEGSGRPFMNGRNRNSITREEGRQFYIDVLGYMPEDLSELHRVFVYGTLKKGQPAHHFLTDSKGTLRPCGSARSVERFPLVVGTSLNIPLVLNRRGEGEQIRGEIYEMHNEKLAIVDEYLCNSILYERRLEQFVIDETGVTSEAWIYVVNKASDEFLANCSGTLTKYTTDGAHGRSFRNLEELSIEEKTKLSKEITGYDH